MNIGDLANEDIAQRDTRKVRQVEQWISIAKDRTYYIDVEHPCVTSVSEKDVQKKQLENGIDQIHHSSDEINSEQIIATMFIPTIVDLKSHGWIGRGGFQRLTVVFEYFRRICR
jgi:hypothetical protein